MENSASPEALASYEAIFKRLDTNSNGWLSTMEFVEDGKYLTRQARQAIFRASDSDRSGSVSKGEYIVNRVITEEAKEILQNMNKDGRGGVTKEEFIAGCSLKDKTLAADVFNGFDTNDDGTLVIPEYLRVWGRWTREAPVSARLIVNQDTYVLPAERESEEFRQRIREEKDDDKLPAAPVVDLVLEIHNTGDDPVMIWPGGGIDEPRLTVSGRGIVEPESLETFSGGLSGTTPQPVILPGKTLRISVESLNPSGFGLESVYWTKPGAYQITATYPVWKNLPPHPPGLFNYPEPKGAPIKFSVKTPPVTVKVVSAVPAPKRPR
jgi:Ca2+-binding EF-hand superfamily protein